MRLTPLESILIIAVVAVCTLLTRALPFMLFGGKRKVPRAVVYLGKILPSAMIATLVVYCLKNVSFVQAPHGLPELIAIALVVALHLWKRNTLLSVAGGTVCYMVLIQCVFI